MPMCDKNGRFNFLENNLHKNHEMQVLLGILEEIHNTITGSNCSYCRKIDQIIHKYQNRSYDEILRNR